MGRIRGDSPDSMLRACGYDRVREVRSRAVAGARPSALAMRSSCSPSSRTWLCAAYALVAAASLWLRQGFPVAADTAALFDDAHFVQQAYTLAGGQWLGDYDRTTLIKGAGYPLFIALSAGLGLPLKMAEQALYLAVGGALASALGRRAKQPWTGWLLFVALAFNPVLWHPSLARVIREGFYLSGMLAVVALAAWSFAPRCHRRAAVAACGGLALGVFWITREEGIAILPALLAMAAAGAALQWQRIRRIQDRHPRWPVPSLPRCGRSLAMAGLLMGAVGATVVLSVKAANRHVYGVFLATEFQSGAFVRAYGALSRIRHDHWQPYVVLPADARARAYAASPAARELQPFLDGPVGELWRRAGCEQTGQDPCREVLSGWFMWALRDAAWQAGHHRDAAAAQAFYDRLASEINQACDSGRIPCGPPRATLAPPFHAERLAATFDAARDIAGMLARLGDGRRDSPVSVGATEHLDTQAQMVGTVTRPAQQRYEAAGWITSRARLPQLALFGPGADSMPMTLELSPTTAADQGAGRAAGWRLRLISGCRPQACQLEVDGRRYPLATGPLALPAGGGRIDIERMRDLSRTLPGRRMEAQQRLAGTLATLYRWTMPAALLLGVVGAATGFVPRPRRRRDPAAELLQLLWVGAAAAVVTRIALLAYLEATSIPSVNMLYASPATPLVILLGTCGTWLGVRALRSHHAARLRIGTRGAWLRSRRETKLRAA